MIHAISSNWDCRDPNDYVKNTHNGDNTTEIIFYTKIIGS